MENKNETGNFELLLGLILLILPYIISPVLLIWAVNTLFSTGIPLTMKTFFAGLVLILLLRYHIKPFSKLGEPAWNDEDYDDEDYDEEEDEDYNTVEAKDGQHPKTSTGKVIGYQKFNKDKKPDNYN